MVALEVEPAEALGVGAWSTDFEQAASETDSASASAPVRSFFMRVLPDGWSVGTPILARRAPGAIAEAQATETRRSAQNAANPPKSPRRPESAGMIGR